MAVDKVRGILGTRTCRSCRPCKDLGLYFQCHSKLLKPEMHELTYFQRDPSVCCEIIDYHARVETEICWQAITLVQTRYDCGLGPGGSDETCLASAFI